ncbi:hypothetical protein BaRGS_00008362 [Batillaria attramentaria]|uniref:Uncharacterized protein n=1 Tax=Batillaria attramentaria TaxID=370345 RepID=A0ABD0LLY7_9CAEN
MFASYLLAGNAVSAIIVDDIKELLASQRRCVFDFSVQKSCKFPSMEHSASQRGLHAAGNVKTFRTVSTKLLADWIKLRGGDICPKTERCFRMHILKKTQTRQFMTNTAAEMRQNAITYAVWV